MIKQGDGCHISTLKTDKTKLRIRALALRLFRHFPIRLRSSRFEPKPFVRANLSLPNFRVHFLTYTAPPQFFKKLFLSSASKIFKSGVSPWVAHCQYEQGPIRYSASYFSWVCNCWFQIYTHFSPSFLCYQRSTCPRNGIFLLPLLSWGKYLKAT